MRAPAPCRTPCAVRTSEQGRWRSLCASFVCVLVLQPECEHLPGVDVRFFWAPTAGAIRRRLPDILAWDRSDAAAAPGVMVFAAGLWDVLHNRNETTSLPHPLRS